MKTFDAQIIEIIPRTHDVKSFRFARGETLDFRAGQFMQVTLEINGQEQSRYLSFSSSPTEKGYGEFTKKMTGSDFSKALECLKTGDKVKIKMSLGSFVLDETAPKQAFLSGGIGITPIRSMLKYGLDRKLPFDGALFYGNHAPEDIVFRSDLEAMAKANRNLKIVLSLDTPETCPLGWKGKCGFLNADMIREELPDFSERIFYVCGPPIMVKHMVDLLQNQLQIAEDRIKKENFAGY
jgi:ferredoxin-NADP reductase